jgi:hypothetical protein
MTFIEGEIIIARPAEAVFDFAADQRNEPRYNPRMVRAKKVTGSPVGNGTVFRSAVRAPGRPSEMRSELTAYHRPAWEEGLPMTGDKPVGWTTGRIIALAAGSVLLLFSLALIAGGGTLVWADQEQVHSGYVTTSTATYSTRGYALASDSIDLHGLGLFVDKARIRITSSDPSRPLLAGIAATGDVERYLGDVSYTTVHGHDVTDHPGTGVPAAPAAALPWAARVQGTGTRTLTWAASDGNWMMLVMNQDASPGVTVRADVEVSLPALPYPPGLTASQ